MYGLENFDNAINVQVQIKVLGGKNHHLHSDSAVTFAKMNYNFGLSYNWLKSNKRTGPNKKVLEGKSFEIDKRTAYVYQAP